jgi:hypothetical protein
LNIFLEKYPEYIENIRLVMLAVPSRSNVPQYQLLKKEIDELVEGSMESLQLLTGSLYGISTGPCLLKT